MPEKSPPFQPGELNRVTPRIFIAATRQDDGKTTSSLGLFTALNKRFRRMAYIKPVGQRFVEVQGKRIDEDSVLISDTYNVQLPIEAMNPITVGSHFTRRYLDGGSVSDLEGAVIDGFNRASWEHDFVIIEGTGHAGVGSVFDMSNAQVAKALDSRVIIVSQGGVGKPIDEISLNLSLFEKYGVEVVGVILNKVIPRKMHQLLPYAEKGLARLGLPLLGIIPLQDELRHPTLSQIINLLGGDTVGSIGDPHRIVKDVTIGAMSAPHLGHGIPEGALLITPGDREDLIMEVLSQPGHLGLTGVVLSDGRLPGEKARALMRRSPLPFLSVPQDSYQVASSIQSMTVKTEPGDQTKINLIQKLVEEHVRIDEIIAAAHPPEVQGKSQKTSRKS